MARRYEQRVRAEQQEETRLRIVRAAVELHGQLGPAATTMSAVAERAGVQRNTLYRHFPDERTLLFACSALHGAELPMPTPEGLDEIADAETRARLALERLYAHWESDEALTANVLRDVEVDPLVREVALTRWEPALAALRGAALSGWAESDRGADGGGDRGADRGAERRAVAELATSFHTWRTLVRRGGLTSASAASVMAAAIARAG